MRKLNPAFLEAVSRTINVCAYFTLMSMEIKDIAYGQCRIEVEVGEKHLQNFGVVHGGVYSSLVDAAAFWAVYPQIRVGFSVPLPDPEAANHEPFHHKSHARGGYSSSPL